MRTALNLDKLVERNTEFKTEEEREIEIGKNLLKLIPVKPKKFLGIKINKELYPLTREELKEILASNNLTSRNYNKAVNELVKRRYKLRKSPNSERLGFEELRDNGNILYQPYISWFGGF